MDEGPPSHVDSRNLPAGKDEQKVEVLRHNCT